MVTSRVDEKEANGSSTCTYCWDVGALLHFYFIVLEGHGYTGDCWRAEGVNIELTDVKKTTKNLKKVLVRQAGVKGVPFLLNPKTVT